jgi:NADPH:quinone reductase-like Zn-dependent oxidoreductase
VKAIFFEHHGGLEVLKYADLPNPTPAPGEALIRVKAVALNHLDVWVRKGWENLKLKMPHIGGSDIAGEIVSVNGVSSHNGSNWAPGNRVIVNPGISTADDEWTRNGEESLSPGYRIIGEHIPGGLAEYVTVPVKNVYKLPETVSFEDGCAPLLVGTTCWRMLFRRAKLQAGETVLVVGSGGGVNSLAIPLAKAAGATVYALAGSKEKADRALALGAQHVINYRDHPKWHVEILKLTKGRGVDIVIDNVGAATFSNSLWAVRRGGRVITVGNTSGHSITFDNRVLFTKQVSIIGSTMGNSQDFIDALNFMWQHNIKPSIDCVEPLSKGIQMIHRLEEGKQFGKIVLKPGL